jgi:hypothetical protein
VIRVANKIKTREFSMGRSKQLRARNEIQELREENRQLRELVAHLSQLALTRITEAAKPGNRWLMLKVPHA